MRVLLCGGSLLRHTFAPIKSGFNDRKEIVSMWIYALSRSSFS